MTVLVEDVGRARRRRSTQKARVYVLVDVAGGTLRGGGFRSALQAGRSHGR